MSIEQPELGEIHQGFDIGKGKLNYGFYQWSNCIDCEIPNWKVMKQGKVACPRCSGCAHKEIVKKRIYPSTRGKQGFQKVNRPLIDHEPIIGEIRYSDEIGHKHCGRKYIWHACETCGKERWVALSNGNPQNPRCSVCAKVGSIRLKSLSPTRKCSKCHIEYPSTPEFFYKTKDSHKGVTCTCKKCRNKQVARDNTRRRRTNPRFRLHVNISKSIRDSIRGEHKNGSWEKIVGYTTKQLMQHLESQFTEGMTWDNYGAKGWEVDHICPQSIYNFTNTSHVDFLRCWALSNLQPMWHNDNILKNNKYDKPFQPSLQIGELRGKYAH